MRLLFFGAFFIMTFFKSLMANSKELSLYERMVHLPGSQLRFKMQEDFSKDMPAVPLIEKVTEDMLSGLKKSGDRFVIGRRWWDLKPQGWFKRSWGNMQMTVALGVAGDRSGKRLDFCGFNQADFLKFYHDSLVEKWRPHNDGVSEENMLQFGVYISEPFSARGQEFIPHFGYKENSGKLTILECAAGQGANIYSYYVLPVGSKFFLEFEFVGAPDLNGSPYLFQAQVRERINPIKESILLNFDEKNCMGTVSNKWIEANSVELLKPDPSLLPKPIPVEEFLKANGWKELPGTKELLGEKENK